MGKKCVGIIEVTKVHQKNSAQHIANLCMLKSKDNLKPVFVNPSMHCLSLWSMSELMEEQMRVQITKKCNFGGGNNT